MNLEDTYRIREDAKKMYETIIEYHADSPIKGSLKRGYVALVLFYSLQSHGIPITEQETLSLLNSGARLSDLPDAQKNMNKLFKLPEIKEKTCDMSTFLGNETIMIVNKILEQKIVAFSKESLLATIYYVCNKMGNRKFDLNGNKITYESLTLFCNKFNKLNVKKIITEIKLFLN